MRYYESNQPIHREHIDITPKGGWEFCDFFQVNSREKRVTFISSGNRSFLVEDGNYVATIEISGENFEPYKKEIDVLPALKDCPAGQLARLRLRKRGFLWDIWCGFWRGVFLNIVLLFPVLCVLLTLRIFQDSISAHYCIFF